MDLIDRDPSGIAMAVWVLATAVLAAADPSGALGTRWGVVIQGVIGLAVLLIPRLRAYKPSTVEKAIAANTGHGAD